MTSNKKPKYTNQELLDGRFKFRFGWGSRWPAKDENGDGVVAYIEQISTIQDCINLERLNWIDADIPHMLEDEELMLEFMVDQEVRLIEPTED